MNEADASRHVVGNTTIPSNSSSVFKDMKSLIKIGIVNSNLITVFAGFWLALYYTGTSITNNWDTLLLTLLGSGLVIAGGCVLNNWYDIDIDPVMDRTRNRPTVTGKISLHAALVLGVVISVLGHLLLMMTTMEAALVAFVGWFTYVVLYTMWSKRRYTLNTAVGSISGAVPPLIGWAAIDPNLHFAPIILFLMMFIWQTPHFLSLAMKKCEDYQKAGIPMLPAVYGFAITKRQIVVYIACLLPLPLFLASLGPIFVVLATVLNIGWLLIGISGFFTKNDLKWANMIFIYSLNYLTIMFLMMIILTIDWSFII
ncbi:protoheme IX farnesyltransferase [Ornithinibacillus gellani]|uniref:heme o synthase n=1 Tax=Ornithinibacillus gellani TaxID=2293253 RepID=UPI000F4AE58E|nr:heme o synthase [Ornithinibacillus gellani]TQS75685.1 protoheme IX farnesyltransferase [Ornithinibacillus gellani]